MKLFPKSLSQKLQHREANNALRKLAVANDLIDFASNDYLGFAQNETIFQETHQLLVDKNIKENGATGSRLLSGNHVLYQEAETYIANFHKEDSALIFNSGYDANVGFFSAVPQRSDVILYDELCHASIRDGIQMSNDNRGDEVYIITESVFSMDGDSPDLEKLVRLSEQFQCNLVVDEAHALGVFGEHGEGLIQSLGLENKIFARIMTFGKGLGCHGAAILGSQELKKYLINFARSFIYTTGLSPHSVATILVAYQHLTQEKNTLEKLRHNIHFFNQEKNRLSLKPLFVYNKSAIQSAIILGNERVKTIANQLQEKGFDVKPILSPTVPEGQERLRFCLHSYNSEKEISDCLELLRTFVFEIN